MERVKTARSFYLAQNFNFLPYTIKRHADKIYYRAKYRSNKLRSAKKCTEVMGGKLKMALTRSFLKGYKLDEDVVESIIAEHVSVVDEQKKERDGYRMSGRDRDRRAA